MAGIAKPDIEGLGKEGKIAFLESDYDDTRFDNIETLLDGDTNKHTIYGVLLNGGISKNIVFEIPKKSNIWAYGQSYSDSGGSTPESINLYKKNNNGEFELIQEGIPTKANEWYLFLSNLDKGVYKIEHISNYTMFTEWYVENLDLYKFLLKQNNSIYTFNGLNIVLSPSQELNQDNFIVNGLDNPSNITEEQWNNAFPDKADVKLLAYTEDLDKTEIKAECEIEPFTPYNKLENEFEICMLTDKE